MFVCSECGGEFIKWEGKCSFCGSWGTIKEMRLPKTVKKKSPFIKKKSVPVPIKSVLEKQEEKLKTGSKEIDQLFGNGITKGAAYLLSGEPGVGKSTFLLYLASVLKDNVLYISGEETASQIAGRARRTGLLSENLYITNTSTTSEAIAFLENEKTENGKPFKTLFVDSIQTIENPDFPNPPGSIVQVRAAASTLISLCKEKNMTLFLTGHINKAGDIAGPKVLEHLVDTAILMYSQKTPDSLRDLRIFKPLKNRFGATDRGAIFIMEEKGLREIDKQELKPEINGLEHITGSCLFPHFVGKRLLFSEIEALTVDSELKFPRRSAEGIAPGRLMRIVAIMEKYAGIDLSQSDIYLNVSGGIRNNDITMDLSIASAIYSSFRELPLPRKVLFLGEAGLDNRIKTPKDIQFRISEIREYGNFEIAANTALSTKEAGIQLHKIPAFTDLIAFLNQHAV